MWTIKADQPVTRRQTMTYVLAADHTLLWSGATVIEAIAHCVDCEEYEVAIEGQGFQYRLSLHPLPI